MKACQFRRQCVKYSDVISGTARGQWCVMATPPQMSSDYFRAGYSSIVSSAQMKRRRETVFPQCSRVDDLFIINNLDNTGQTMTISKEDCLDLEEDELVLSIKGNICLR
ncbi:hypothetical protein J6590_089677 [Homalodisca vitripennis]|nr:hypothetical protein J6590_089677 [Homalodisca vitripennis]